MSGNDPVSSSSIGAFSRAPSNEKKKADGEIFFLLDAPLRASVSKNEDLKKCISFFNHLIDVILRRQDTRSSLGLFYFFFSKDLLCYNFLLRFHVHRKKDPHGEEDRTEKKNGISDEEKGASAMVAKET